MDVNTWTLTVARPARGTKSELFLERPEDEIFAPYPTDSWNVAEIEPNSITGGRQPMDRWCGAVRGVDRCPVARPRGESWREKNAVYIGYYGTDTHER